MTRKRKVRRERGAAWEPKVFYRPNRNRWMVDCGWKLGTDKRLRKLFATEEEAAAWAATKRAEYLAVLNGQKQEEQQGAYARLSALTDTQRRHLVTALAQVDGDTAKILRALTFYDKHTTTADASRLLADVCEEYLAAKEASGKRPRTIRDAKGKLAPFLKSFGTCTISQISTSDVESWLNNRGYTPGTRNAYRVAVSGLFTHAVRRRYTEHNPAAAIEAVTTDQRLPAIHTTAQVEAILRAANNYVPIEHVVVSRGPNRKVTKIKERPTTDQAKIFEARSKVVPYLAIGYFAGLRPENELVNLDWKDVDFAAKAIRVSPATAKKRRQRYVDISDNLIKWLAPYARKTGKIGHSRSALHAVRDLAGVKWAKDVMRHSYGSYLLAHNEDAPKTALQMGHTGVDVLFNHYRNLVKKSDAVRYWAIVPDSQPNVVQLPVARAG